MTLSAQALSIQREYGKLLHVSGRVRDAVHVYATLASDALTAFNAAQSAGDAAAPRADECKELISRCVRTMASRNDVIAVLNLTCAKLPSSI